MPFVEHRCAMQVSSCFRGFGFLLFLAGCSTYTSDLMNGDPILAGTGGNGGAQGVGGSAGRGGTGTHDGSADTGSTGGTASDAASDAAPDRTLDAASDVVVDMAARDRDAASDAMVPDSMQPDGGSPDAVDPDADAGAPDVSTDSLRDGGDVTSDPSTDPIVDGGGDSVVDSAIRDADAREAETSGPLGPQTLPPHGVPIGSGTPFDSRCNATEVVTGFHVRAGAHTDSIAAICSTYSNGMLSAPRNLPLNGNTTGGSAQSHPCPANYVAAGLVGTYGHNNMWDEDILVAIGVVCRSLANPATTQIVAITSQPPIDSGSVSFREDCTTTRMLTSISGTLATNSLGLGVQRVGGECNPR
jgi:hypothetical protein